MVAVSVRGVTPLWRLKRIPPLSELEFGIAKQMRKVEKIEEFLSYSAKCGTLQSISDSPVKEKS